MVFYHHTVQPQPHKLPRYLDLGLYAANEGIPFTQSSNLLYALKAAVECGRWNRKFNDLASTAFWLRAELHALGYRILAQDSDAVPAVIVHIALPLVELDPGRQRYIK